ncbi:MAG: hypothetical protein IKU41_06090 [Clostridia bacterium]|nr:hypothetical protein [Clostridia bacterium]
MALIKCSECGKEISSLADFCPNCGCPSSQFGVNNDNEEKSIFVTEESVLDSNNDKIIEVQEVSNVESEKEGEVKKSKSPVVLGMLFGLLMAILAVVFIIVPYSNASNHYETGINNMESGDYYSAYCQFQHANSNIINYKDIDSLKITCVQKLMDEKNYEDAFKCITDDENLVKRINVKEEDYEDLGKFIDNRLIKAFSKYRYEAYEDTIACYAIATNNVLPNDYGNVKAYINIGAAVAVSYAEFSDEEDFFISVSSILCDTLKNNSKIDLLKRILEQDNLIKHFLSGETPERRHENYDGECISTWNATKSDHQFFIHGIGNGGWRSIGNWKNFQSPEHKEAEYYYIKNSTYYISFEDKSREDVEEFTITINSYSNITITSCTTNKKMTMTRMDFQSFWNN